MQFHCGVCAERQALHCEYDLLRLVREQDAATDSKANSDMHTPVSGWVAIVPPLVLSEKKKATPRGTVSVFFCIVSPLVPKDTAIGDSKETPNDGNNCTLHHGSNDCARMTSIVRANLDYFT